MDFRVIGVGEVLWDLLLTGPQLGGAPANFAYHAHALGAQAQVLTRVGRDDYGGEIIRRFHEMGLPDATIQLDETAPTGTAKVKLSGDGLPHFTIQEDVAWDYIAATGEALAAARLTDAICFGSLAQRGDTSRRAILQLVAAAPANALRVFDINLRQRFYTRDGIEESLRLANVLKLNDDELPILAAMFSLTGSIENQIERLGKMFDLRVVALTRGANGSLLYQRLEEREGCAADGARPRRDAKESSHHARWSECPSRPVEVIDTVGAGDSFTAALVLGLLRQMDLDEINEIANEVARYVCSQYGATPRLPLEFAARFSAST
jgi:fructokinase